MTYTKAVANTVALDRATELYAEWQKASLGAVAWANPTSVQRWGEMNAEVARFATEWMLQSYHAGSEMLQCADPVEFREVQGRYLKTTFENYCAEAGKLGRMNQIAMKQAMGRRPDI